MPMKGVQLLALRVCVDDVECFRADMDDVAEHLASLSTTFACGDKTSDVKLIGQPNEIEFLTAFFILSIRTKVDSELFFTISTNAPLHRSECPATSRAMNRGEIDDSLLLIRRRPPKPWQLAERLATKN